MVRHESEVKIYDVSAGEWISGIEQDDICPITLVRTLTDEIGDFEFLYDITSCAIQAGDIVMVSLGEVGSSTDKWFVGQVTDPREAGTVDDRYFVVKGKEISSLLLNTNAPFTDYDSTAQSDIVADIMSSVVLPGSSSVWVSSEPVYISQKNQWLDLAAPTLISGSWTVEDYAGNPLSYTTDFTIDTATTPPTGRIKIASGSTLQYNDYVYITYQTEGTLPYGRIDSGVRVYHFTTNNLTIESEEITLSTKGLNQFNGIRDTLNQTSIQYDFYVDEDMDLHTFERSTGTLRTYDTDDVSELEVTTNMNLILNETMVKRYGSVTGISFPIGGNGDELTEFSATSTVAGLGWTVESTNYGVFDASWFSDTTTQKSSYGGAFNDAYDLSPTVNSNATGVKIGNNYVKGEIAADGRIIRILVDIGGVDLNSSKGKMNFFDYTANSAVTGAIVEARTSDTDRFIRSYTPHTDGSFTSNQVLNYSALSWQQDGDPTWTSINTIAWTLYLGGNDITISTPDAIDIAIDGFYFGDLGTSATYSDATSQSVYGVRKTNGMFTYPIVDNTIQSWQEAYQKARAIVETFKDPIYVIERAYFDDGNLDIVPGDLLKIEKDAGGTYYPTVRVVAITQTIDGSDLDTVVDCQSADVGIVASYISKLDKEIRNLEMGN